MNFLCECGHRISDTTDYISYKAYLTPDQDWFDYFDEVDKIIQNVGVSQKEKEDAMVKVRVLSSKYTKTIYQCQKCGNIFFDNDSSRLEMFRGCSTDIKKDLLQSVKGDKWQGFLYGEWVDSKPDWLEKRGYICAPTQIKGRDYDDWETLEREYYITFNELINKNMLRFSSLKKNRVTIHLWSIDDGEKENLPMYV